MGNSAFVHLVDKSKQTVISLEELKDLLKYYQEITTKTGEQLNWEYGQQAFPYDMEEHKDDNGHYLLLRGKEDLYQFLLLGVGEVEETVGDDEIKKKYYIQITLPEGSTHGDKGKGNELGKFLGKKLEGELHLFNNRVMYYYKRK